MVKLKLRRAGLGEMGRNRARLGNEREDEEYRKPGNEETDLGVTGNHDGFKR